MKPRVALTLAVAGLAGAGLGIYFYSVREGAAPDNARLVRPTDRKDVPNLQFQDASGKQRSLGDFRGKVVLLNIWATWCAPCREEMPALDRLQATLGGPAFEVVALSIDQQGPQVVRRFFDGVGIKSLQPYIDPTAQAAFKLATVGVPATLLIDRSGREVWRRVGPAKWDAAEMVEDLRRVIEAPH